MGGDLKVWAETEEVCDFAGRKTPKGTLGKQVGTRPIDNFAIR